jgi:hypothetical protein
MMSAFAWIAPIAMSAALAAAVEIFRIEDAFPRRVIIMCRTLRVFAV